jgi:hypothetical protein
MKEISMPHRPRASRLAALVLVASGLMTGAARAQDNPPPAAPPPTAPPREAGMSPSSGGFGAPGTWVFTFETADNGYGFAFFHKASGGDSIIVLNPGVDYFLAPNISLGANLFFSHNSAGGGSTGIGAGVRAGYNLNIVDNIGFWPSARFFLIHNSANGVPSSTDESLGIFGPFIWHPTTHFFLGGGPDLNHQLSNGGGTEYGLDFILGGWL